MAATTTTTSTAKHVISDSEILAQTKNRHEESMLGARLQLLQVKKTMAEDCLAKTKKQLITSMKKSLRTSGSSPNPENDRETVNHVDINFYQIPWAYSFSETTHNAIYKEISQLPRKLPCRKTSADATRMSINSTLNYQRNNLSTIDRSKSTLDASNTSELSQENAKSSFNSGRKIILRSQSCRFPRHSSNDISEIKANVRASVISKRPVTCENNGVFIDSEQKIDIAKKQSRIINKVHLNPLIDAQKNDNNDEGDSKCITRFVNNSEKMSPYAYNHRSKIASPYVWFRGRKIRNYIKPQERYKKDPLNLMKREKLVLKLSMNSSDCLEESRKSALKSGEAFPKAARLRLLNHLIENNLRKSGGPMIDYNAQLKDKIERFIQSIDELCESRNTITK